MTTQKRVLAVIMGGGRGTRLAPLTLERCKPAVPLAVSGLALLPVPLAVGNASCCTGDPPEVVYSAKYTGVAALVSFVGLAAGVAIGAALAGSVGWFPLGWNEPYRPWYHYSPGYMQNVNRSYVSNVTNITNVTIVAPPSATAYH